MGFVRGGRVFPVAWEVKIPLLSYEIFLVPNWVNWAWGMSGREIWIYNLDLELHFFFFAGIQ